MTSIRVNPSCDDPGDSQPGTNDTTTTPAEFPEIVCLCGSTRFADVFQAENLRLTLEGVIVLSIGANVSDASLGISQDSDQKRMLDELHLRKIDLADRVHVLNVPTEDMPCGYIGVSTLNEIAYAKEQGKVITWLT